MAYHKKMCAGFLEQQWTLRRVAILSLLLFGTVRLFLPLTGQPESFKNDFFPQGFKDQIKLI